LQDLLGEPPHIVEERKCLAIQMQTLKKAMQVLQRDPNIVAVNFEAQDDEYNAHIRSVSVPHRKQDNATNGSIHTEMQSSSTVTPATPTTKAVATSSPGIMTTSASSQSIQKPESTKVQGLFGSRPSLFEKEPAKRQATTNPLFEG